MTPALWFVMLLGVGAIAGAGTHWLQHAAEHWCARRDRNL